MEFYQFYHFTATNQLTVHTPLISGQGMAVPQALILFHPKEGELGAFIICDADRTEEDWIEKAPFLPPFHLKFVAIYRIILEINYLLLEFN